MACRWLLPNGITGLVMAMAMIMFAFGGIELVGLAAETDHPTENPPKAVNQIVYRVLLFYILSLSRDFGTFIHGI